MVMQPYIHIHSLKEALRIMVLMWKIAAKMSLDVKIYKFKCICYDNMTFAIFLLIA